MADESVKQNRREFLITEAAVGPIDTIRVGFVVGGMGSTHVQNRKDLRISSATLDYIEDYRLASRWRKGVPPSKSPILLAGNGKPTRRSES